MRLNRWREQIYNINSELTTQVRTQSRKPVKTATRDEREEKTLAAKEEEEEGVVAAGWTLDWVSRARVTIKIVTFNLSTIDNNKF